MTTHLNISVSMSKLLSKFAKIKHQMCSFDFFFNIFVSLNFFRESKIVFILIISKIKQSKTKQIKVARQESARVKNCGNKHFNKFVIDFPSMPHATEKILIKASGFKTSPLASICFSNVETKICTSFTLAQHKQKIGLCCV